ncbi:alpha/beta-hydrolase [Hypoxylon trugodes]|uniref:alpha/beta-hydrolase n=1 Tax=Hypoxylon trugodes TaxID=326681 RepID=UPI00219E70AE|nr:alpha/beta-hydrolase [Hypoxylon trugodes]KAI1391465.1 alpha/beta-hydrolase [Hypoxylon trugodes]
MMQFNLALISTFGLLAIASPVPETPYFKLNKRETVSAAEVSAFDFYAQYAAAAYCNSQAAAGSTITCSEEACPDVNSAGAKIVSTFSGDVTDIQGFVSSDDKNQLIVVSVKGSESIRNWIADLTFIQTGCDLVDGCEVHAGFLTAYNEIADSLLAGLASAQSANPSYKIIFTGHSLGGAVSTVAAGYARNKNYAVDLYTYGSPRVGNEAFVNFITQQAGAEYRVTHLDDPVPRLPPIAFDYRHTSPEYWLSDGTSTQSDYTAADIKVCDGFANTDCNGGTDGLDIDAHLYYFEHISGCGPDGISFKPRSVQANVTHDMATSEPEDVSDEELTARLNDWAAKDRELSAKLNA